MVLVFFDSELYRSPGLCFRPCEHFAVSAVLNVENIKISDNRNVAIQF